MPNVEVTLTNRYAYIVRADSESYAQLDKFWSFNPLGYRWMPSYRGGHWNGRIKLLVRGKIPAGLFRATRKELEEQGFTFSIEYNLPKIEQPDDPSEPRRTSKPVGLRGPKDTSKPKAIREPIVFSRPLEASEPSTTSHPKELRAPELDSEPTEQSEPKCCSPEPSHQRVPEVASQPSIPRVPSGDSFEPHRGRELEYTSSKPGESRVPHPTSYKPSSKREPKDNSKPLCIREPISASYQYQDECIAAMYKAMHRGGGIILSTTGSGKTSMAAKFFKQVSYNCLFVVDTLDLLYQSQLELSKWLGEEVGIVGDSVFTPKRVTVATIQTLHKHIEHLEMLEWCKTVKVIIVDELHEQMAKRNWTVIETIKPIARYGLTATLQLKQKHIRYKAFSFAGPVLYEFPIEQGIAAGVLTKGRVLQLLFPATCVDGLEYQMEYDTEVVCNVNKQFCLLHIVKHLLSSGKHVIVLVDRVQHIESLSSEFEDVSHKVAYGKIDKLSRKAALDHFEQDKIQLILANRVFKKGINVKVVDVIIDLAEMKSKNDAVQKFGRGVRLHPDKTELLYIDFGTYDSERFHKAARSRARALRAESISVRSVKVKNAREALQQVVKELKSMEKAKE